MTYEIESPPEAGDARMPPMMLLPLIDHVIVHGLEPSRASSSIRIGARVDGGKLTLTVGDSDSSFVPGGPGGDGIQSIRDRLSALYGEQGRLELRQDNEHDSQAVIKIPYEQGPEAG